MRRWPALTVALLVIGYAGFYLCRANFSATKPLLQSEAGVSLETLGWITSIGTALYALGKFVGGTLTDLLSGRTLFLTGMMGAVVFTFLFGLGGPPLFLLAWSGNRFLQSFGWGGMVKITGRWFGYQTYGRVMALISLSYLFGDAAAKFFVGGLINAGWTWSQIFVLCGAMLFALFVPIAALLRESPTDRGLPEPAASPSSLTSIERPKANPTLRDTLAPLLRNRTFWVVCVLSFAFTLMRDAFNEWTPMYLNQVAGMGKGDAAQAAAAFPLFGGLSVLAVGWWVDRAGLSAPAKAVIAGLLLGAVGLFALSQAQGQSAVVHVAIVSTVAVLLIGPYSLLAGAVSLDFGGKDGSASAAGWIDGVGYLGGILAGKQFVDLVEQHGWSAPFQAMAALSAFAAVVAWVGWRPGKNN
jgi:OPA family glycerol-3-phosphate transporter-like MFS transporter